MIFVSSQPDNTFFIWQLLTLYENLKELGVPKENIHCLVGHNGEGVNKEWEPYYKTIHATVHFIVDDRESRNYSVSIRPHIIKKFLQDNSQYQNEYIFYHDADICFSDLPIFEGMEDGRIHVSRTDYLDWKYIKSKHSPTLMKDLLSIVGIDEETIRINEENTGGAQVYAKGLTYDYWDKVEHDCEAMYKLFWNNYSIYKREWEVVNNPVFDNGKLVNEFDFQHWTIEMWCMLWNQWLYGFKVYANPELTFTWPNWKIHEWDKHCIFHNSGLLKQNDDSPTSDRHNSNYLFKGDYYYSFPTNLEQPCLLYPDNEQVQLTCQYNYIQLIKKAAKMHWGYTGEIKPIIYNEQLVTYYYIVQDETSDIPSLINIFDKIVYTNKKLVILNIYIQNIVHSERDDVIILNSDLHFSTAKPYSNQEQMLIDINKFSSTELTLLPNVNS